MYRGTVIQHNSLAARQRFLTCCVFKFLRRCSMSPCSPMSLDSVIVVSHT